MNEQLCSYIENISNFTAGIFKIITMRNIIYILIVFIIISCKSNNKNVIIKEKWSKGNPKLIVEWVNEADKSYYQTEYYENKAIKSRCFYKAGKLDGTAKFFDEDGFLINEKIYREGILKTEYNYKNGKLDGSEKLFHSNGQLWTERLYKNGLLWDVVSNYDSTGKAMDPGTLKEGYGIIKLYDTKGKLLEIMKYREGKFISRQQANDTIK